MLVEGIRPLNLILQKRVEDYLVALIGLSLLRANLGLKVLVLKFGQQLLGRGL